MAGDQIEENILGIFIISARQYWQQGFHIKDVSQKAKSQIIYSNNDLLHEDASHEVFTIGNNRAQTKKKMEWVFREQPVNKADSERETVQDAHQIPSEIF